VTSTEIVKFKIAIFNYPIGMRIIGFNQIREQPVDILSSGFAQ
jgi:hypothetical protein